MTSHLEEKLQNDIHHIRDRVREMADLALRGLEDSVRALNTGDTKLAYAAILRDSRVDDLESLIDGMCVEFIVRHIPVATHLRFVHSVAKIVSELERVGDYAESINRQAIVLSRTEKPKQFDKFERIAGVAVDMMRQAVRSFLDEDLDLAKRTIALESEANVLHHEIYQGLVSEIPVGSDELSHLFSLLSVANRYERVADQAVNICEEVYYMLTGDSVKHQSKGAASILFLSSGTSSLASIAEAIASTVAGNQFAFAAATTGPGTPDAPLLDFLAKRGINLGDREPAKSLAEIGSLSGFRIIVAVDQEAAREIASHTLGFRTVVVDWDMPDALADAGPEALSTLFDELLERITGLVQSLHGTVGNLGTSN
ncbi:MAG TPA: phosphate signaling complex protein PhoU [Candidatus Limnocylindrales bacterium]|nr:phosphate signaling complex protein PhoU [Candidatus Limnocylindrales bacterium]